MEKRRQYRELPDIELSPELDAKVRRMTAVADRQIEPERVSFRWGKRQLATIRRAAEIVGIPYQMYMKDVLFRQAVADICQAEKVEGRLTDA